MFNTYKVYLMQAKIYLSFLFYFQKHLFYKIKLCSKGKIPKHNILSKYLQKSCEKVLERVQASDFITIKTIHTKYNIFNLVWTFSLSEH